ncbi:Tfp pilus assembly protein PilX [Pelomonas saccharophila]|uniref:Tfp pilus assembly protein PilX n=1 Tax=Roseateles saccharophilus TaxID=304 RepID=A0ABU1YLD6_ROSSA|nr:PilX N-terminal domain-containing pilus assembly protein [Roseateles saccharophilus]MDR7269016.1 Tfp pilus assembly protein PilX [Roseateles saccharophilus]
MPPLNARPLRQAGQRGLVLVLALVVLAAMSLAAVGLMRGVFGSNRVAGNLAYQQAAVQAADVGVETAIAWLEQRTRELEQPNPNVATLSLANKLYSNIVRGTGEPYAYVATRADPPANQTWDAFWQTLTTANVVNNLPVDAAGNQVSFVIHRLCANAGEPSVSRCEAAPVLPAAIQTSSKSSSLKLKEASQVYYRITVRVLGPRNATSFIQTMVAI